MATERIGDWVCTDENGFRAAYCMRGPEAMSVSYDVRDPHLLAYGRIPREVVLWMIRDPEPAKEPLVEPAPG